MLRKCKYFLLSFIFFISSILPCMYSYAQGETWTDSEKVQFFAEGFYKIVTDICGLILPTGLGGQNLQADYQTYVLNNNWIQDNMTYDEWIASQISGAYIDGNNVNSDVSIDADLRNSLTQWANEYSINNSDYMVAYSYYANQFNLSTNANDRRIYNVFLSFLDSHSDEVIFTGYGGIGNLYVIKTPIYFVKYNVSVSDGITNVIPYNENKNNVLICDFYQFNNSTYTYDLVNEDTNFSSNFRQLRMRTYPSSRLRSDLLSNNIVSRNSLEYVLYKYNSLIGTYEPNSPSYYVTDSYNNNIVSDSYNTTTSAIDNTVSYGDVQNYVNNYYVENNEYPTSTIINNYINNYDNSGGSGGDNGGDNGGSGSSNIWDFLGSIRDFLGSLIEGLGNVLSGILSLLTDVIDMFIGEDGLPNTISQLIAYFIPFLPEEYVQLILLSITLMVIVGIIKLIRG